MTHLVLGGHRLLPAPLDALPLLDGGLDGGGAHVVGAWAHAGRGVGGGVGIHEEEVGPAVG